MKIIRTDYYEYTRLDIKNLDDTYVASWTFNTVREVDAFMEGWRCCQSTINSLVQRLPQTPQSYERIKN